MDSMFRRLVSERVGEDVLYSADMEPIVRNLGGPCIDLVRKSMKDKKIDPADLGINHDAYGCNKTFFTGKTIFGTIFAALKKRELFASKKLVSGAWKMFLQKGMIKCQR